MSSGRNPYPKSTPFKSSVFGLFGHVKTQFTRLTSDHDKLVSIGLGIDITTSKGISFPTLKTASVDHDDLMSIGLGFDVKSAKGISFSPFKPAPVNHESHTTAQAQPHPTSQHRPK